MNSKHNIINQNNNNGNIEVFCDKWNYWKENLMYNQISHSMN